MAVPKRRRSKAKKRTKRANWKVETQALRPCPQCGAMNLSHFACSECGFYKDRQVIEIKEKAPKKES